MADTAAVNITLNNPRLSGLPVIVTAQAMMDRQDTNFRRIVLKVTVIRTDTSEQAEFEFSSPVDFGTDGRPRQQNFDIASAVRAMADGYEYDAHNSVAAISYPSFRIAIESYEEYMRDGMVYKATGQSLSQSSDIYIGTLSDLDRLYNLWPTRWTRKPTSSRQIAFVGHRMHNAGVAASVDGSGVITWTAPAASVITIEAGDHADGLYYGIPAPRDGYHLRFINSLGTHDDCFLQCLRTTEVAVETERYVIARQESVMDFSRGIAIKKNDHERWKMSSGPLDKVWQQWYLHEVLMAQTAWLLVDGRWVQCHILPEETVIGMDRQKSSLLDVQFTIEFDINGSVTI